MSSCIAILGSTGSIGTQTLEVAETLGIRVAALSAGRNIGRLYEQILRFHPRLASVADAEGARQLTSLLSSRTGRAYPDAIDIAWGEEGNRRVAETAEADTVVAAMVGIAGLDPVLAAIRAGKHIALANKETLVAGGAMVMPLCRQYGVRLLPVDSEHSAIWQCLWGNEEKAVRRILLTASGGPFRMLSSEDLAHVKVSEALAHPTWNMGGKITIDSATMMNKGLEVIEATWLFNIAADAVQVVVHPQSIVHSMVEFQDRSVMAQLGFPDMRLPIQVALTYPERVSGSCEAFDPFDLRSRNLTFEPPDKERFPCLELAYAAARIGGSMPAVLNSANEAAVGQFLSGSIGFSDIPRLVESCMGRHVNDGVMQEPGFGDIMELDRWARAFVRVSGR
ncbi:MAG TPA: 1-deoxy-D-xylulose-5-phosphate reductoisomerase [Clostridia bacterium]